MTIIKKIACALVALSLISFKLQAIPLRIQAMEINDLLQVQLLQEVIKRSDKYDSLELVYKDLNLGVAPPSRKLQADLNNNLIDIIWSGTTKEDEQALNAIYVPIYKGLLGFRLAIINQGNDALFSHVNSVNDLAKFIACQGTLWADTTILEHNGVTIAKSLKYENLFTMLDGERCDYYPRGAFELYDEMKNRPQFKFTDDKYITIRYKLTLLFFTSKKNQQLRNHLTSILEEMIDDGTYDRIFYNNPTIKNALKQAHFEKRKVIALESPLVSDKVKQIPEKYWFDPTKGSK